MEEQVNQIEINKKVDNHYLVYVEKRIKRFLENYYQTLKKEEK